MLCRCPNRAMLGRIGGSSIPRRSGEGGEHAATSNLPSFYFPATRNRPCRRRSEASFIGDRAWVEGRECEVAASTSVTPRFYGATSPCVQTPEVCPCVGDTIRPLYLHCSLARIWNLLLAAFFLNELAAVLNIKSLRHGCILWFSIFFPRITHNTNRHVLPYENTYANPTSINTSEKTRAHLEVDNVNIEKPKRLIIWNGGNIKDRTTNGGNGLWFPCSHRWWSKLQKSNLLGENWIDFWYH
jgi:hypothetical protein